MKSSNKRKYIFGFSESRIYEEVFEAYNEEDAEELANGFAEEIESNNDSEVVVTHLLQINGE
jgi:hypothetical protein|tara:strand:- start:2423 stop:2608 length:186 start_codon:yes stop_codon:yes gene_type:complete